MYDLKRVGVIELKQARPTQPWQEIHRIRPKRVVLLSGWRCVALQEPLGKDVGFMDVNQIDLEGGETLGEYEYRLTPGRILRYTEATDDNCMWFQRESPFGGVIAPATIFDNDMFRPACVKWRELIDRQVQKTNVYHVRQEYEFHNPARPGMKILVTSTFIKKCIKGKRTYVTCEVVNRNQDGLKLVTTRCTLYWRITAESSTAQQD